MVYICLYMVNIWLIYKHWGFIKLWLSQFQVIQHLPYFSGSCIVSAQVKKPFDLRDDPLIRMILAKVWKGWIPRLDSRVGSCWMMRIWGFDQGPNMAKFKMIWDDFRKLSFIPNMCYFCGCRICFFHVWRLRCKNGISWDVFHCGKNPRSEVRMVSSLSKACWLINNFLIWAEKKSFTCFTIHYNIHY